MNKPDSNLVRQLRDILKYECGDWYQDGQISDPTDDIEEALTQILSAIKEALPKKMKHTRHDEIQMNEAELKHYLGIEIGYNAAIAEMEKMLR